MAGTICIFPGHSGAVSAFTRVFDALWAREPGIQKPIPGVHLDSGSGADAPSRNDAEMQA
jgi:hypothetical protein